MYLAALGRRRSNTCSLFARFHATDRRVVWQARGHISFGTPFAETVNVPAALPHMVSLWSPNTPRDVRVAITALVGWAVASVGMVALYFNPYRFQDNIGAALPNVGVVYVTLVIGFTALAATLLLWALALSVLASPQGASGALRLWRRAVAAESRRHWAVWAAVALAVGYAAVHVGTGRIHDVATLEQFAAGEASKPFQYRALVGWAVAAVRLVPGLDRLPLAALYGAVDALSALGVWLAFRTFLRPHVGAPGAAGDAARSVAALAVFVPLLLGTAVPWRHNPFYFPYDTSSVAAFTLGLALLQEKRWRAYYVLFAVATLNRETTCFLTIAWALTSLGRVSLWRIAAHSAVQLAVWVAIKSGLSWMYAANAVLHDGSNGLFVTTVVRSILIVTAVPGLLYFGLALGGSWLVVALLRRRLVAPELTRWFRFVPVFLFGMSIVGELLEVRIYGELVPLVTAALLLVLASVVREAARPSCAGLTTRFEGDVVWVARGRSASRERAGVAPQWPTADAETAGAGCGSTR